MKILDEVLGAVMFGLIAVGIVLGVAVGLAVVFSPLIIFGVTGNGGWIFGLLFTIPFAMGVMAFLGDGEW